jgi:hypothetical protein
VVISVLTASPSLSTVSHTWGRQSIKAGERVL